MKKLLFTTLLIACFGCMQSKAQRVIEFGIKPTELAFLNIEANFAFGTQKTRYGVILAYRPSTKDSELIKSGGTGAAGGYDQPHFNKLYNAYTFGVYQKTYINKYSGLFLETDIFYRNWSFKKKPAEFRNVEGYNFKGVRTENINVCALKVLLGKTFLSRKERKFRTYWDVYAGAGIRYREESFETFNGYVNDVYYAYKKDKFYFTRPSPQLGVKLGLVKNNKMK